MSQASKTPKNILNSIGNTPLVEIKKLNQPNAARILAKLESFNPGGSVKDRIALAMIDDAEKKGRLKPGATIIEPTSGNTGIGLALVAAAKGYKVILTMPENMSEERKQILKSYGAELVLTPAPERMPGAIKKAEELSKNTPNSFMPQQFTNEANPEIHRKTTAKEIIDATEGKIDAFVAGVGTGGTITGVGEVLKKSNPNIKIVAVEPAKSPVLSGGTAGPHKIQGIGAGFIPEILNRKVIDQIITVDDNDAFKTAKALNKEEGVSAGISSGAAMWAALKISQTLGKGKTVVVIFPDGWEKYVSMEKDFNV
ncbi:MAG TPA: cysteine synthase A [Candidatus Omnitrophota bacterium]|nr:cysteine synthase A [Candidatus Omnitrophota bacterium]